MGGTLSSMMPAAAGANDTFVINEAFTGAYAAAMEEEQKREQREGAYSGGGCGCGQRLGGAAGESLDLAEASQYVDSINSKSKTRIIESILEAAGKLGLKSEGSTPAARIKSLLAVIPAGDRFKRDDKAQAQVCESIAKAINAAYGVKVMETNLPADALCQHIAEILSSLGAGVHTEFLAVYNDVQKVLHNMGVLQEQLTLDMNQIKEKIRQCEDGVTAKNLQLNFDLYEMLVGEIKRQVQLLSNLLNVHLVPSAGDLAKLLKDKKELHGWIKKINLKPGDDKFGRVISDLLRGLGVTANFMLIVEQALQTVGLTLSQYKEMKNLDQLRAAAVSKGVSLTGDELHKFNDALELLEKNLSKVKYTPIQGAYSQDAEMFGSGLTAGNMGGSRVQGSCGEEPKATGAYSGGEYARSTMDKRVADRKKLRNLIYETFVRQLNGTLDKFVGALDVLSMKIGTEIPISDQLDGFRQAINRIDLELARKKQVYLALIGYYNDAMSKSKRDQVVGEMKMVSSFIDSIVELPMYRASAGHFQAVQAQIKSLLDLIGKYSEEIAAKFGRGEEPARNGSAASAIGALPTTLGASASAIGDIPTTVGSYGAASAIGLTTGVIGRGASAVDIDGGASAILESDPNYGGMGDDYEGAYAGGDDDDRGDRGDLPAPRFRATKTLSDAVRQFDYKFRVAQIRGNLSRAGAELSHYGEKYEKITANSLAELLKDEQKKYSSLSAILDVELSAAGLTPQDKKELQDAKAFLNGQWDAKKKFWSVVEAVDSYMRAFTNGFVNNPNDIKDIRAILDDVEVIRDWYSESSGNQLASVFDHFPSATGNDRVVQPTDGYTNPDDNSSHYYQTVEKNIAASPAAGPADLPGNPNNVTDASHGLSARANLKKMLSSMSALKNLLSVFVHFGSKFGGNDLNKSTFLTPAQIYNNLIEYLQASAFQQGFGIHQIPTVSNGAVVDDGYWNTDGNAAFGGAPGAPAALPAPYNAVENLIRTDYNGVGYGVAAAGAAITAPSQRRRHWGVWMRSTIGGINAKESPFNFKKEDEYFVLVMKSIAAKVLTVTGMYDVMDRPYEFNGITPIRMIMGGDDSTPKVEEGAVALYLRLPLLCQFWRSIFNFDERPREGRNQFEQYAGLPLNDTTQVKISMVPDVDGTFAGLIRLMFRKNRYLDTSSYSDDDIKEIIRECNMIYQKMAAKHPQNTVMETIYEIIAEVNRRYGIVTKTDRDKYELEFGNRYDYSQGNNPTADGYRDRYSRDPDPSDIALLPGEDEEAIPRPSGAERLLEGTDWNRSQSKDSKYKITTDHKKLINSFRCAIDQFFENPREEYSFNGAIKSTQQKLKRETRDEERFKIVASLVRGVDVYSKVDGLKYLIFHETVVAGLNVLSGLHSMLSRFQARAQLLDINWIVDNVQKFMISVAAGGAGFAGVAGVGAIAAGGGMTSVGLGASLLAAYRATGGMLTDADVTTLLNAILGETEADECNSGTAGRAPWVIRPTADMTVNGVLRFDQQTIGASPGYTVTAGAGAARHHLAGVLEDLSAARLKELFYKERPGNDEDAQNRVHCFFRYLLNRELVMKELIESLFGLSSDLQGLVNVRIDDGKLYMNTGGLKSLINELFDQVGYFMELMRPHVRAGLIDKYTSKIHVGSLYWLQEQLLEKIVLGRAPQTVVPAGQTAKSGYNNLDDQMRSLSDTYGFLTRAFKFSGNGLVAGAGSQLTPATDSRNSFDKVFASLIFYDGERPGSGLLPSNEAPIWAGNAATSPPKLADWSTDNYEALLLAGPPGAQVLDTRFAARFYQLYSWKDELTLNRSALFVFNQLVAKFIQSFYDPGQKKMYKGLIDQFANGTFNRAIADHRYTFPDVAPTLALKVGEAGDVNIPPDYSVFVPEAWLSVGTLLRQIMADYEQSVVAAGKDGMLLPAQADAIRDRFIRWWMIEVLDGERVVETNLLNLLLAQNTIVRNAANGAAAAAGVLLRTTIRARWPAVAAPADPLPAGAADLLPAVGNAFWRNVANIEAFRQAIAACIAAAGGGAAGDVAVNGVFGPGGVAGAIAAYAQLNAANAGARQNYNNGTGANLIAFRGAVAATAGAMGVGADGRFADKAGITGTVTAMTVAERDALLGGNLAAPVAAGAGNMMAALPEVTNARVGANGNSLGILMRQVYIGTPAAPAGVPLGERINRTMRFIPNNVGGLRAGDHASRANMFADIWLRVAYLADTAVSPADFDKGAQTIASSGFASRKMYSQGSVGTSRYIVKSDELNSLDKSQPSAANVGQPLRDESVLLFARREAVNVGTAIGLPQGNLYEPTGISHADDPLHNLQYQTSFGKRLDPDGEHVLFTSLAVIIRNMVHTRTTNQTQNLVYMTENMADVPLYMKEKLRANLPAFKNLFRELSNRCEFLKKFLMRREMNVERHFHAAPAHNPWPWVLLPTVNESEKAKDRFSGILDTIVRGSQTLIAACENTLKEVGDDPKYLELHSGAIRDYRAQYGVDPLMPVSSLLAMMRNVSEKNELDFFPIHSLGELHFKLMHGSRSLLQNMSAQPTAESVPGWNQTIESFNLMVDGRLQADAGHADGMLKALTKGVRYLYDLKRVKGLLTPHLSLGCVGADWTAGKAAAAGAAAQAAFKKLFSGGSFVRGDLVGPSPARFTNKLDYSLIESGDDERSVKPAFSVRNELSRVVMLTESSNKDDQLKNLVDYISGDDKKDRPNTLAVQNVIDLNIIPINIHALMREIPLANLYNYAYTYDRMVAELFYNSRGDAAKALIDSLCADAANKVRPNSPKDMLVQLLLDPYYSLYPATDPLNDIDSRSLAEYVQGMLLGSTGEEGLGRPKFLSDQVYGKAIFGELYTSWAEMSDMGPAVRYPRTLLRNVVRDQLSEALTDIINNASAAGAKFKRHDGGTPFTLVGDDGAGANPDTQPSGNELASMILDHQTASISELAGKIARMTFHPRANGAAGAPATNADNRARQYAVAIIAKTVGSAFLWAINQRISGSLTAAQALAAFNQIVDSLQQLTFDNGTRKLNTDAMKRAAVNNKARSTFKHIIDSLDSFVLPAGANDPIQTAAAAAAVRGAVDVDPLLDAATNPHLNAAGVIAAAPPGVPATGRTLHDSRGNTTGDNKSLHYLDNGDLKSVAVLNKGDLAVNGRHRFDTVLIRNLVFIVNLYRSVRMKLQQDLTYSKDIVTKSLPITRAQLTEFSGNAGWQPREYRENARYQ